MKKKKIILISYYFPPIKAVGVIRNLNIAHQFQKYFNVKVISTKNRLPENEELTDFDIKDLITLDYKTILKKKKQTSQTSSSKVSKKILLYRRLLANFPFNLFLAEGGIFYILHGIIYLLFTKKKDSIIYSSFSPMADHYIAYVIKVLNPKVYWISDYRDIPYNPDSPNFIWPKFQKFILKKLINKADLVTTVSNGLKDHFNEYRISNDVYVLRNGVSNLITRVNLIDERPNLFKISYTGNLYPDKQDSNLLFLVIKTLIIEKKIDKNKIKLVYAGKQSNLWFKILKNHQLESIFDNQGFVTSKETLNLQYASQINLLLTWSTKNQKGILTGKFYEYLKAGKPIVLLINGEDDSEFEGIMDELNAGVTCYNDELNKLKRFILTKYQQWDTLGKVEKTINQKELNKYTWDYQFDEFYKKLNKSIL